MPKIIKNVKHIMTTLPIGLNEAISVCTTNFKPGALLITLNGLNVLNNRNTLNIPNNFGLLLANNVTIISIVDIITKNPSIIFQPLLIYAFGPNKKPFAITFINISTANITANM